MFTKTWFKDMADRVGSTALFAFLGYLVSLDHFDLWAVNWKAAINATVIAAAGSLLKAVVVGKSSIGTPGTATPIQLDQAP